MVQAAEAAQQNQEEQPRTYPIPAQIYAEFTDVNIENEEFFKYMSYHVLLQFVEKTTDMKWILQFPKTLPSQGRSVIHDIATTLGLASHSVGAKHRSILVYPRNWHKDKQEQEARKHEKEYTKLKERSKALIAPEDPKTIRDKMIALISEEGRENPTPSNIEKLRAEIFHTLEHVPEDFDAYMLYVKPIIEAKKVELS
mmetsp:Transcript_11321/g.15235  ORF Transcript_11321/g.15235 Transcript_11321/m.15235 type:complete len:198 (+) Transcript_11321:348-941(+)